MLAEIWILYSVAGAYRSASSVLPSLIARLLNSGVRPASWMIESRNWRSSVSVQEGVVAGGISGWELVVGLFGCGRVGWMLLLLGKKTRGLRGERCDGSERGAEAFCLLSLHLFLGRKQLTSVVDGGNTRILERRDFSLGPFGFCTTINSIE